MIVEQRFTPEKNTNVIEQCNFSDGVEFYCWNDSEFVQMADRYTVAVWRLKAYKSSTMKPEDWSAIDYPNNIDA